MNDKIRENYALLDEKLISAASRISVYSNNRGSRSAETVSSLYTEAADYIQSDTYTLSPPAELVSFSSVENDRMQAMQYLQKARDLLKDPFYRINPYDVLNTYAYGYDYYKKGCPVDALLRKEQDVIATYNATGAASSSGTSIDKYDESLAVSCGQLQAVTMMIREDFGDIKWQGRDMPNKFYVSGSVGLNDLQRPAELENYENQYYSGAFAVGLMHNYSASFLPDYIAKEAVGAELEFGYIGGDDVNLGSHRWSPFLWAGFAQYFGRHLYLKPQVGSGMAFNSMDFGKGLPLELDISANLGARGLIGASFDLNTESSFFVEVGYLGEASVAGDPVYYNQGPVLRVGVVPNGNRVEE